MHKKQSKYSTDGTYFTGVRDLLSRKSVKVNDPAGALKVVVVEVESRALIIYINCEMSIVQDIFDGIP